MFLDISAIINRKKQEKVNSGFGIYEVYDNNTVISILKGIDQKKPGAVFLKNLVNLKITAPSLLPLRTQQKSCHALRRIKICSPLMQYHVS